MNYKQLHGYHIDKLGDSIKKKNKKHLELNNLKNKAMNIFNFINQTITKGGSSYNPEYGIVPESGYMVSIKDAIKVKLDLRLKDSEQEKVIGKAAHDALTIHGGLLVESDNFLGSWISDDGYLYIDIAKNVQDLRDAIRIGMLNDQLAIYDIIKDKEIKLPTRQKAGTSTQQDTYIRLSIDKIVDELKQD